MNKIIFLHIHAGKIFCTDCTVVVRSPVPDSPLWFSYHINRLCIEYRWVQPNMLKSVLWTSTVYRCLNGDKRMNKKEFNVDTKETKWRRVNLLFIFGISDR